MKQSSWLRRLIEDETEHPYIILDSGAYSVWRSGKDVNVERFENYCCVVRDYTLACVNLDVIPGKFGTRATPSQVEEACEISFQRWKQLNQTGALIMPVYHQSDDITWLDRYIDAGAEYIGISPTDNFSATVRQNWLADVHEYLVRRGVKLRQEVFTHALGVFSPRVLYDMPLWSADASTMIRYAAWTRVMIPEEQAGRIKTWHTIYVGARSKHTSDTNVDWDFVRSYLDSVGHHDSYRVSDDGRVIMDDFCLMASVSLNLARRAMHESGVRCFIAGYMPLGIWQVAVVEKYPYILRSFAPIKESHGNTIKDIYNRKTVKPGRRPEKDKVVVTSGLFPQLCGSGRSTV